MDMCSVLRFFLARRRMPQSFIEEKGVEVDQEKVSEMERPPTFYIWTRGNDI